jgi:HEAT repeat protein
MPRPEDHVLALILARLVSMLRQKKPSRDAQRATLHALTRHTQRRSATVRVSDDTLLVEGHLIPDKLPLVPEFVSRLRDHGITEIRIAQAAAALDLIDMLRLIAADPSGSSVSDQLRQRGATGVQVLEADQADAQSTRRSMRVTDALDATAAVEEHEEEQGPSETVPGLVPATAGAAFSMLLELTTQPDAPLSTAVANIKTQTDPDRLSRDLTAVTAGIGKAIEERRVHEAIDAITAVIRYESKEKREALRSRYAVALKRVLTEEFARTLIPYLLDELYAKDVGKIMSRAGPNGTRVLAKHLVSAKTYAERRAFLTALKHIESGKEIVVSMLDHHEWYVVRNFADVVGELKIREGIPALGRAVTHEDSRVRLSSGVALAKIGVPETVRHLNKGIHDVEREVRLDVLKHLAGRGLASFVMPLLNLAKGEDDPEIIEECYRALGRIGTSEAVRELKEAATPSGFLRRGPIGVQLAAIQGLSMAGGVTARDTLKRLLRDRTRAVRDAAEVGLKELAVDRHPTAEVGIVTDESSGLTAPRQALSVTSGSRAEVERRRGGDRRVYIRRAADRAPSGRQSGLAYEGTDRRVGLKPRSGLDRRMLASA